MFVKWHHVERIDKKDCDGILNGLCYVSFKLDGTNASIWADLEGTIHAGSRTRELSLEEDNAGFYAWVMSDEAEATELRKWCQDNPHYHIFGEWGVGRVGSIKKYTCAKDKNFYLFGACFSHELKDENSNPIVRWLSPKEMLEQEALAKYMIPIIEIENPTEDKIVDIAEHNHYLLPENVKGEGVVINNPDFKNCYGRYVLAKFVLDEYKQNKRQKQKTFADDSNIEQWIVDKYCTAAEMSKTAAKVCNTLGINEVTDSGKGIGMFLNILFHDSILQECDDWGNSKQVKIVNFPLMKNLTFIKGREFLGL